MGARNIVVTGPEIIKPVIDLELGDRASLPDGRAPALTLQPFGQSLIPKSNGESSSRRAMLILFHAEFGAESAEGGTEYVRFGDGTRSGADNGRPTVCSHGQGEGEIPPQVASHKVSLWDRIREFGPNRLTEIPILADQWSAASHRRCRVKRSTKAGIASAVLFVSILVPPYREWRAPISLACAVLSCILGALAATSGRKWWLVIPASIVAGFALDLYLVIYAL
jgi:hypothetical protein